MTHVPPVACPACNERQNEFVHSPPATPPGDESVEVRCMACGHVFTEAQYRNALARAGVKDAGDPTRP